MIKQLYINVGDLNLFLILLYVFCLSSNNVSFFKTMLLNHVNFNTVMLDVRNFMYPFPLQKKVSNLKLHYLLIYFEHVFN